mmetsp:Transcript_4295/g.3594  ORF Transcript_4295/g.3594 Transcript_4295/m.3594 type:complete len:105 (-) Transcript_4295:102-416(-)
MNDTLHFYNFGYNVKPKAKTESEKNGPMKDGEMYIFYMIDEHGKEVFWVENFYYARESYAKAFEGAGFYPLSFIRSQAPENSENPNWPTSYAGGLIMRTKLATN